LPFVWATEATVSEKNTFTIGGKAYASLHQINPNTCLQGGSAKSGCGGSEMTYVPGLGRVAMDSEGAFLNLGVIRLIESKSSYRVWAVAGP
jgi:hypothetical protein